MNNIYYLKSPQNDLKLTLKELIQLVNVGEIDSMAFAGTMANGNIISGKVIVDRDKYLLIGALEYIKREILNEMGK